MLVAGGWAARTAWRSQQPEKGAAPRVYPASPQGAVRGLAEELGIAAEAAQLAGPLAPTHRRELHVGAFHDVELVQSYRWAGLCEGAGAGVGGEQVQPAHAGASAGLHWWLLCNMCEEHVLPQHASLQAARTNP